MRLGLSPASVFCFLACVASVSPLLAQDVDFGIQAENGKLIVGRAGPDVPVPEYPVNVLTRNFLPNNLGIEPGFFAYGQGSPAFSLPVLSGIDPLPPSTALGWDFLTMTVDSVSSNLFVWDGLDDSTDGIDIDDVDFTSSVGVQFTFNSTNGSGGGQASVTGTDDFVAGATITSTSSSGALTPGSIHHHPLFQLSPTGPDPVPVGVYMVSLQVRMAGLQTSDPFFMVLRSASIDEDAETAAADWIEANLDMLLGDAGVPGDYDGNGLVEPADLVIWQQEFGSSPAAAGDGADGNADGAVNGADYAFWRNIIATQAAAAATAPAVPEPTTILLMALALPAVVRRNRFV